VNRDPVGSVGEIKRELLGALLGNRKDSRPDILRFRCKSNAAAPKNASDVSWPPASSSTTFVRLAKGLTGALAAARIAWVASRSEVISERRFSRRLRTCIVGLPARANDEYEPFHVARLLLSSAGEEIVRTREPGSDSGRGVSRNSEKSGLMGDGGAYISESWDSSVGVVRAAKS
jgi:hypothetical protein